MATLDVNSHQSFKVEQSNTAHQFELRHHHMTADRRTRFSYASRFIQGPIEDRNAWSIHTATLGQTWWRWTNLADWFPQNGLKLLRRMGLPRTPNSVVVVARTDFTYYWPVSKRSMSSEITKYTIQGFLGVRTKVPCTGQYFTSELFPGFPEVQVVGIPLFIHGLDSIGVLLAILK